MRPMEGRIQNTAKCSNCEVEWAIGSDIVNFQYCPNCGAKMDEEVKG